MKYLSFEEHEQKMKQKLVSFHYIFSIDGSGSMNGPKWISQIQQITQILQQLSKDINNKVSINVFTDDPYIYCQR